MNEDLKNIETCLPESILAEVASVPTDPQFVSLVNESFDPLKQQAVQQAGSDAYNEVVASHQPYTFTSQIRQMKSNLILLLRRLWRFPFGSGTIPSLSDMWAHYITRLQGSETYGIPSRLDQLTDLPSAPLLVADRKISGVPEAEDGISLVHIIGTSQRLAITELTDNNEWSESVTFSDTQRIMSLFPNVESLEVGIKELTFDGNNAAFSSSNLKRLKIKWLEVYNGYGMPSGSPSAIVYGTQVEELDLSAMKEINRIAANKPNPCQIANNCSTLRIVDLSGVASFWTQMDSGYPGTHFPNCENIEIIKVGKVTSFASQNFTQYTPTQPMTKLIRLEFGEGTAISLNLAYWNPSYVLSDNPTGTDLVEDQTAHPTWNNLQQFLSNFRSFIVLRLANRKTTTALTLTLSANVYNAVTGANSGWASQHTLADLGITDNDLTDLETELGFNPAETTYASWLDTYTGANGIHWDINKAN